MILNGIIALILGYFTEFDSFASRLRHYPRGWRMSAKYRLSVVSDQHWPTQQSHGLFATTKLLVHIHYVMPVPIPISRLKAIPISVRFPPGTRCVMAHPTEFLGGLQPTGPSYSDPIGNEFHSWSIIEMLSMARENWPGKIVDRSSWGGSCCCSCCRRREAEVTSDRKCICRRSSSLANFYAK